MAALTFSDVLRRQNNLFQKSLRRQLQLPQLRSYLGLYQVVAHCVGCPLCSDAFSLVCRVLCVLGPLPHFNLGLLQVAMRW